MKKRIIATAAFAACLALCAAVWPQNGSVRATPAPPTPTAVVAAQPEVPEAPKITESIIPEEEKTETARPVPIEEAPSTPEPASVSASPVKEAPTAEQECTAQPIPEQEAVATDSNPDLVYVPGFGWLESQGPNHCEYAEDMYENGNKIGIMG